MEERKELELMLSATPVGVLGRFRSAAQAMRPHQWAKNLLIFAPLLLGHRYAERHIWVEALIGFIVFSLTASSVYLFNDLLDLKSDRVHKTKRHRAIASGLLPIPHAILLLSVLLFASFFLASRTPEGFRQLLAFYLVANLVYTSFLKRILFLDVLMLSAFYTVRLYAGGAITGVPISHWLSGFSLFLFLSLAILKRFIEVDGLEPDGKGVSGRDYQHADKLSLFCLGAASGYMSIVVFSLYTFSDTTRSLYISPQYLWVSNFLLLYWISTLWIRAGRKEVHDDPILFVVKDRVSISLGVLIGLVFLAARFIP